MIAVYRRDNKTAWEPSKAMRIVKAILLNSHTDTRTFKELEKFIFDVPPSQRDESWALQVQSFIETYFPQTSHESKLEAQSN